jgi:hypothetical protein
VSLLLVLSAAPGFTWGAKAHVWITQTAVSLLPEGALKEQLSRKQSDLAECCLLPDAWSHGASKISLMEAPQHYIDLDAIWANPQPGDLLRTRIEASRLFTKLGLPYDKAGFLPWQAEECYHALVNACKANPSHVAFYAAVLSHYVADASQPLHTTKHYDGRVDRKDAEGNKYLKGIHADYETEFIESSSFSFPRPARLGGDPAVKEVFPALVALTLGSFHQVGAIYTCAEKHQGTGKYAAWDQEIGPMTRRQLSEASTLLARLWWTAWKEAGSPKLESRQ